MDRADVGARGVPDRGPAQRRGEEIDCDLLAADLAYPEPLLQGALRRQAHQSWTHGQVLLVEYDGG